MDARHGGWVGIALLVLAFGCGRSKPAQRTSTGDADASDADASDADASDAGEAESPPDGTPSEAPTDAPADALVSATDADNGTISRSYCPADGDKTSLQNFGCNCNGLFVDVGDVICRTSATIGGVTYTRTCRREGQYARCCDTPPGYYRCTDCAVVPTLGTACDPTDVCSYEDRCPRSLFCNTDHKWATSDPPCPTDGSVQ